MSIVPCCSSTSRISASTDSERLMSTSTPREVPPSAAAAAIAPEASMSAATTVAPAAARHCAMASPIPRAAPVTTATRPSTRMSGEVLVMQRLTLLEDRVVLDVREAAGAQVLPEHDAVVDQVLLRPVEQPQLTEAALDLGRVELVVVVLAAQNVAALAADDVVVLE